jgi:energy-coupling factor transporter ATP-binding protein EcfA2
MAAEIDFQPYLQSISTHYAQWWQLYTLTDAETKAQQKNEPQAWKTPFDFGLMVQTVQGDRLGGMEGSGVEPQAKEKIERFPVLEGIRKYVKEHRQVLLVGRPGSGKSTTLARLLLEEARNVEDPPSPLALSERRKKGEPEVEVPLKKGDLGGSRGLRDSNSLIPVLVELRFLSDSTLIDRIQAFFQRHGLQLDRTQIEDLLFHQRLLLLMDGLNELPSEAARLDVARFRQDYPKVSMIFTTRDLSLGGDFGLEKKLEMQPLTETQMQAFVRSYVPEQAEAMLRQLKDRLREFGQTPLLLWMLCGLFRQTGQIPANLGEVFRAFTQGYEKNLKADVPVVSNRKWWTGLLQELAFAMMHSHPGGENLRVLPLMDVEFRVAIPQTEVCQIFAAFLLNKEVQAEGSAQKCLDDLLRHHLIQLNGEQVEFRHQLLQEYYAAEYLLAHWEQISELEFRRDYLNYLKWTEPIVLMLALANNERLVLQVVDSALGLDLMLGAKLAGASLLKFQEPALNCISNQKISNELKIHLLGLTRSELAIPLISKSLTSQNRNYRDVALGALYEIHSEKIIPSLKQTLLNDLDGDICGSAATILGELARELCSETAVLALEEAINHESDYVRTCVSHALGSTRLEIAVQLLQKAYADPSWEVRRRVIDALAEMPYESVVPIIAEALKDIHIKVRRCAIEAFGYIGSGGIGDNAAIAHLSDVLLNQNIDPTERATAAFWMGDTGNEAVLPSLRKALYDSAVEVQKSASYALKSFKNIPIEVRQLPPFERIRWKINRFNDQTKKKDNSDNIIPEKSRLIFDLRTGNFETQKQAIEKIKKTSDKNLNQEVLLILNNLLYKPHGIDDLYQILEDIHTFQSRCKYYNHNLTQTTQSMKLFFSYAHKDEPLRDELAKHLSLLKRQNIITDWHDRNITAGTDWAQAIDDNLNTANIILLLISSDFLALDYCYDKEMTRALENHTQGTARVIPIILRPCDWHSAPFGKLQALPKDAKPVTQWSDPDEAFTHIAQGIRKAVAELQQPKNAQPNPKPAQPPTNVLTQITYDLRGANIGNWAENQYGTQQTTQIQPNPSQPPETPQ